MSQYTDILSHLKRHGSIDPMQALSQYGCYRLAARIEEMRNRGHVIFTAIIPCGQNKKRAEYRYRGLTNASIGE